LRPVRAGFSGRPVAEDGAAAREVGDALAIGPRNAIDQFEKGNTAPRLLTREAASEMTGLAATLLFAHGQTTR